MASRSQSESRTGSSTSTRALSRRSTTEEEQTVELPRIAPRMLQQGSPWTTNNPAIRQLSSLFRVRSAPKYYPLGLWHHQKEPEFPDIRNSCLITAGQHHGSRSSGHLPEEVDKVQSNQRNELDSGQGRVDHLPPLLPNKSSDGVRVQSSEMEEDHEKKNHQASDLLPSNGTSQIFADNHLPEINQAMITKEQIERDKEGSFGADSVFPGDKISPGSVRIIPDTPISANARKMNKRPPPPLVRRKKVEFTEDMLPKLQNETETANEGPGKEQSDDLVNDILNDGGNEEAENNDDVNDNADILTAGPRDIGQKGDHDAGESGSENNFPREQYPPINTFYICLILGKAADAQLKSALRQVISRCRLQLLNKGFDLEIMTFDLQLLSNLDPRVRQDVLDQYLDQCQRHGLGPFYWAVLANDEEDKEPPLTLDCDVYEHFIKESEKVDADILREWYKLDESVHPHVYRIKYVQDVIENYKMFSTGEKTDGAGDRWNQTKQQLARILVSSQKHDNRKGDALVDSALAPKSVEGIVLQRIEKVLGALPDGEFLRNSRRTTVADLLQTSSDSNAKDTDTYHALSRHFIDFIEEVTKSVKIINKRRTNDFEKTPAVLCERWSHWRYVSTRLPESRAARFTTLVSRIRQILLDPNNGSPIVVKSESPEMDLSLIGLLRKAVTEWIIPKPVVVVQLAGITERTSRLDCFLETLFEQVGAVYGYNTRFANTRDVVQGSKALATLLNRVSKTDGPERPLVLLLGAANLSADCDSWMPKELPDNVYIVATASPDSYLSKTSRLEPLRDGLLQMEAVHDDDKLGRPEHFTNDTDRAEALLGQATVVRDALCLLAAHENGMTESDIADALRSLTSEYASELVPIELLDLSLACVKSLLSSLVDSVYDSGKLLYRLPSKYHSDVIKRYLKREDGKGASVAHRLSNYQKVVIQVYAKQLQIDQQLGLDAPERGGLIILLKWRLLAFIGCLSSWPSPEGNTDIFRDTIFNFYWLSGSFQFLAARDVAMVIWQLRQRADEVKTLCVILESHLADATEVSFIASGILACVDRRSAGSLLAHLYDTTKEWLTRRGASLVPCGPTIEMPRIEFVSVPGPTIAMEAFNDNLLLTYGLHHGLQVWDMKSTRCLYQVSPTRRRTMHDVRVNVPTKIAYYTEETFLIGWNIADGTRTLQLELLPRVSATGRRFDPEADLVPFLSVADVSGDGRLVAIRINHREMLTDNKGVFVVSVKDGAAEILGAVGDGLFGRTDANIRFSGTGTILTITQKLDRGKTASRIVFVNCDLSSGELHTVTTVADQSKDPESDQVRIEELDVVGDDPEEQKPARDQIGKDDTVADPEVKTGATKTERNSSEENEEPLEDAMSPDDEQRSDSGQRGQVAANRVLPERDTSKTRLDSNTEDDTTGPAERTDPEAAVTGRGGPETVQQEDSVNDKTASGSKGPIRRQEALDAADEATRPWDILADRGPSDDVTGGFPTVSYAFEAGVMTRCPSGDSLAAGYLPNGVAIIVPKEGLLRPLGDLRNSRFYKIAGLVCLGDGRVVSAHSRGGDGSPLMLCVWSPEPSRLYLEHRGVFRSIERAPDANSVMVLHDNKIVIMDVDLPACTHVLDFPAARVHNAIYSGGVLYVGTAEAIVTRKLSEYAVPPPYDVIASGSNSPMLEDGEEMETISLIDVPSADLPAAMKSFGPGGVTHAVLLPGGQKMAVGVAGKLKLMDVRDGSLQGTEQEERIPLLDVFLVGSKAESLVALQNDANSPGMNILKWDLDSITEPPKVVNSGIVQGNWRLSSNRSCLLSLSRRDQTDTVDVCIVNLEDLDSDKERHYSIHLTGRNLNFAVSDSGRYVTAWENRSDAITIWNVAKSPVSERVDAVRGTDGEGTGEAGSDQEDKGRVELETGEGNGIPDNLEQDGDEERLGQESHPDGQEDSYNGDNLDKQKDTGGSRQPANADKPNKENTIVTLEQENTADNLEAGNTGDNMEQENTADNLEAGNTGDNMEQENTADDLEPGNTGDSMEQENTADNLEPGNTGNNMEQENTADNLEPGNTGDNMEQENTADNLEPGNTGDNMEQENTEKDKERSNAADHLKPQHSGDEMEEVNTGDDLEPSSAAEELEKENKEEQVIQTVNTEVNNVNATTEPRKRNYTTDTGKQFDNATLGMKEVPIRVRSQAVIITGDLMIAGSTDGYLYQLDLEHLFCILDNPAEVAAYLRKNRTVLVKEPAKILSLVADGDMLISLGPKDHITLLDLSNPREQIVFESCQSKVTQTALSGDRKLLLVSYADETIRLWNARTGHAQCSVPVHTTIHWLSFAQKDNIVLAWVEKYKGKRSRIIKFDLNR